MLKFNKDGTIVSNDGFFKDKCLSQEPCSSASTPPCEMPAGWGVAFCIVVLLAPALYLSGGIGYAFKMKGVSPSLSSHPHHAYWLSLSGMVVDGCKFTVAGIKRQLGDRIGAGGGEGAFSEPLVPEAAGLRKADAAPVPAQRGVGSSDEEGSGSDIIE